MKYPLFMRWSGLLLLLGGVFLVIFEIFTPTSNDLKVALQSDWVALHTLGLVTNLFVAFGLIGLYMEQAEQGGAWELLAFGLAFLACGLSVATVAIHGYVFPAFARMSNAPQCISPTPQCTSSLIGSNGPLAFVGQLEMVFAVFFLAGFIFLSIIIVRAGVLSRWPSWLLLISSVLGIANMTGPALIGMLSDIVFGVALAWLGFLIWSGAKARILKAQPVQT